MSDQPKPYYCLHCMRAIEPMIIEDNAVYVHDDVPHPVTLTFDEEKNPQ